MMSMRRLVIKSMAAYKKWSGEEERLWERYWY